MTGCPVMLLSGVLTARSKAAIWSVSAVGPVAAICRDKLSAHKIVAPKMMKPLMKRRMRLIFFVTRNP